jgi:hypothetical protein
MPSLPRKEVPDERFSDDLAQLAAASIVDAANVPALHLGPIQTCRVARLRWPLRNVCSPPGSLQVLLAAVLLGFPAGRRMSIPEFDSGPTSNDLLESLIAEHAPAALNHQVATRRLLKAVEKPGPSRNREEGLSEDAKG